MVRIPGLRRDPHALAGAYALDALAGRERTRFARHLASCATCPDEVRGLFAAAAELGVATVGEALLTALDAGLPFSYLTTGQSVPEDLAAAGFEDLRPWLQGAAAA